jgi:hypothetical protein
MTQVALEMAELLKLEPTMKVEHKISRRAFYIKWKPGKNYASANDCFAKMIELYEAKFGKKLTGTSFFMKFILT